jgi:hypothetical protein
LLPKLVSEFDSSSFKIIALGSENSEHDVDVVSPSHPLSRLSEIHRFTVGKTIDQAKSVGKENSQADR